MNKKAHDDQEEAYQTQKQLKKNKQRVLKSTIKLKNGSSKFEKPIVSPPEGDSEAWFNQIPFEIPDLDKISKDHLERYILVLSIIEENLKEYTRLKGTLTTVCR